MKGKSRDEKRMESFEKNMQKAQRSIFCDVSARAIYFEMNFRFIKAGDRVSQFDDICEVQSDKASVTITSRYDGVVRTLHYKINDVARVGNALVDIELEEDDEGKNAVDPAPGDPVREEAELDRLSSTETTRANKVLTTPAVRRLAFENNIDLTKVAPTGRDGRIMKEDVLAYLANSGLDSAKPDVTQQPTEGRVVPLKRYTKHMYKTMTQSLVRVLLLFTNLFLFFFLFF